MLPPPTPAPAGSLFSGTEPVPEDGRNVLAVCVLSVIFLAFSSMPQLALVFATKRYCRLRAGGWGGLVVGGWVQGVVMGGRVDGWTLAGLHTLLDCTKRDLTTACACSSQLRSI